MGYRVMLGFAVNLIPLQQLFKLLMSHSVKRSDVDLFLLNNGLPSQAKFCCQSDCFTLIAQAFDMSHSLKRSNVDLFLFNNGLSSRAKLCC